MLSPLRFHPYLRPMVWGGRALADRCGKILPTNENYGESWEISDHPLHYSIVSQGPFQGQTLHQLLHTYREALVGPSHRNCSLFPWLVKFLDCHDWLSVQVHPDESAVRDLLPGEQSKTEAWLILDARPEARVYAGLQPGVDAATFERAMLQGTVADCLHSFVPKPGDCLFLPAGTVHAVGGGVLLAEVQQTSDATFRLFDWNRLGPDGKARPLHRREGLASIHWQAGPVTPIPAQDYGQSHRPVWQSLVRCPYFELTYVQQKEPFSLGGSGQMLALMVLHGSLQMDTREGTHRLSTGETVLLPASCPEHEFRPSPNVGLLLASLPRNTNAA